MSNDRNRTTRRGSALMAGVAALALVAVSAPAALGQDGPFIAEGQEEGTMVVATAGGTFQESLGNNFYQQFTDATGIEVTPITINPDEQWAKIKADTEVGNVQWDLVNVGPDSLVLQAEYLASLGEDCADIPNMAVNAAEGVCQGNGFLYILGGHIGGYDTSVFPDGGPSSAADFFDTETYPGPRCMSANEPTYNMIIALSADGVSQEDLWPLDIDRALAKLDEIKDDIAVWWDSGDQSLQAWRNGECVMSTLWAGRAKALQNEGATVQQMWDGFPRDISGFGVLADAPHPNAAKAFINYFFSDEAAEGAAQFSAETNYDPANLKAIELMGEVDDASRATNPDNWNAMRALDVTELQEQQTEIVERWQEWISQ